MEPIENRRYVIMKKTIALLIAIMMLCLPMAMAEEAQKTSALAVLGNINVMGQDLGEDFFVCLGIDGSTDTPNFIVECDAGEETLLYGIGQIADGQLKFTFDGDDTTYVQDLTQNTNGIDVTASAGKLCEIIPQLDSFVLPAIPGLPIPKLDASTLLSGFVTGSDNGAQTFAISTEAIDSILDMAQQSSGMVTSQVPQAEQLLQYLPMLKGMLSMDGTIAEEGDAQVTRCNLNVQNEAQGTLVFTTRENNVTLGIEAAGSEMGALDVVSSPDDARLDVGVNAMGMDVASINIYQDGGLQNVDFIVNAGTSASIKFAYGNVDGRDLVNFDVDAGSDGSVKVAFDTAMEEDTRTGSFDFSSDARGQNITMSASLAMYLDQLDLSGVEWPSNTQPFDQIGNSPALQTLQTYFEELSNAA